MKVILLQDGKKQGKKDQIIYVSDGYANNYLIKNGLAIAATEQSKKRLARELDIRKQEEEANIKKCQELFLYFELLQTNFFNLQQLYFFIYSTRKTA